MNTLIVSTFTCSFESFEKFVADFHQEEGHKYVKEYELIKVNDGKSHLILQVFFLASNSEMQKKWTTSLDC